ncbi:MAG TPA: TetR/AcrR family transcriptional regulator [Solirubrobacterales bacterium]|nr:TetR/AcrR family transcriptional regulator [Solirubrobacterales bacterium]
MSAPADCFRQMVRSMNRSTSVKTRDERKKLIDATVAETVGVGYSALSVEGISRRAGLSSESFYSHFADEQAATEAAYECLFEQYLGRLLAACKTQSSWPLKVKVGIGLTLDTVVASPAEAQFVVAEPTRGHDELRLRMVESHSRLARLLAAGRSEAPRGAELPDLVEFALVGGVCDVISNQLYEGEVKHLPALAPELVEFVLTFYLGSARAVEVARRPRSGSSRR